MKSIIERLIQNHWNSAINNGEFGKQWEHLKLEIGCAVITYGTKIAIKRRADLIEISAEINNLIERATLTVEDQATLNKLLNKLNIIYEEKAKKKLDLY